MKDDKGSMQSPQLRPSQEDAVRPGRREIYPLTDLGNADLFAEMFKDEVRYVTELDTWLIWSDGKWVKSKSKLLMLVRKLHAKRRAEAKHPEGGLFTRYGDPVTPQEVKKWTDKSQSRSRIEAMLKLAMDISSVSIPQGALDHDHLLLGVENGVLDLRTATVRAGHQDDLITQSLSAKYDPEALCPGWKQFIDQVSAGRNDLAGYLQEILGYSLCGSVQEQQLFVFTGKGANGKSTLVDVFLDLLGDYGKTTPAHSLMKSESRAVRNDIARLRGTRFVSAVEINTGKQLDEALVKRLTGGDKIAARFIGKEFFEFVPQAKFFLAVNTLPEVSGADDGIYRRVKIVPFELSIAESDLDKSLPERLKQEKVGILTWAVEGFIRWYKRGGFDEPTCVKEASKDFRSVMDTIGSFLDDKCTRNATSRIPKSGLFAAYQEWAKEACIEPVKMKTFGTLIGQQGFKESKTGSTRFWKGLSLPSFRVPAPTAQPPRNQPAPVVQ